MTENKIPLKDTEKPNKSNHLLLFLIYALFLLIPSVPLVLYVSIGIYPTYKKRTLLLNDGVETYGRIVGFRSEKGMKGHRNSYSIVQFKSKSGGPKCKIFFDFLKEFEEVLKTSTTEKKNNIIKKKYKNLKDLYGDCKQSVEETNGSFDDNISISDLLVLDSLIFSNLDLDYLKEAFRIQTIKLEQKDSHRIGQEILLNYLQSDPKIVYYGKRLETHSEIIFSSFHWAALLVCSILPSIVVGFMIYAVQLNRAEMLQL